MNYRKTFENSSLLTLIYVLIAMACSNFMGRGSIVLLLAILCFMIFVRPGNIKLDKEGGVIALLSLSLIPVTFFYFDFGDVVKTLLFCGAYVLGYWGYHLSTDKATFIRRTIFSIFCGFSANVVLTYFYNLDKVIVGQRNLYNIWTGERASATLFGLLSAVIVGYSFYGLFCSKGWQLKLFSGFCLVISLLLNLGSATRSPFVLFVIVYTMLILLVLLNKNGLKGLKYFAIVILVLVGIALCYMINLFGIQDFILQSPLFSRIMEEGVSTSRVDIAGMYFDNMPRYPWGGIILAIPQEERRIIICKISMIYMESSRLFSF